MIKQNDADFSGVLGTAARVRSVNGQLIVKSKPKRHVTSFSEKQLETMERFLTAVKYGRDQIADPESRALYEARITDKKRSAFLVAMSDCLSAPKVKSIQAFDYTGMVGSPIQVQATDDFEVVRVKLIVSDSAGNVIEQGEAEPDSKKADLWEYTATANNPSLRGTVIKAIAFDRPGNVAELEKTL